MYDTLMTLIGNVVENPTLRQTKTGTWVANFRVASTPRRFDQERQAWVDGRTLYVQVTAWRGMARNVADSVRRGDPVLVHGRYSQKDYTGSDEKPRTSYELEAVAVGHDLARGVSSFSKVSRPLTATVEVDDDGIPADVTAHYLELAGSPAAAGCDGSDDDVVVEVDVETGEVREYAAAS